MPLICALRIDNIIINRNMKKHRLHGINEHIYSCLNRLPISHRTTRSGCILLSIASGITTLALSNNITQDGHKHDSQLSLWCLLPCSIHIYPV